MPSMSGRNSFMDRMPSGAGRTGNIIPKGYKHGQIQQFTPEQMQLNSQLYEHVSPDSYLSRLASGEESYFNQMEAPALRQFNELQGNLASRFSGMGLGARRSSGFQNASSAAASNFAQELQANRQALQRQALLDLRGFSESLLNQRPYEQFLLEKQPKPEKKGWGSLIGAGLGAAGGAFFGNPVAGAQIGYGIGSAF